MGIYEILDALEAKAKTLPDNPLFDYFRDDISFYLLKWRNVLKGGFEIEARTAPQIYFSEMSDDMLRSEMEETGEIS